VIDRVDVGHDTDGRRLMIVYDYKSSAAAFNGTVLTGARLQLLLYLLALEQAWAAEPVLPAGVFLAPLYPDLEVMDREYVIGASAEEQLMHLYRPRGLVEERAARLLDTQLGTRPSPVAALQLKKGGGFYARSDACAADVLAARLGQARATLLQAAEGIAAGCLDIAPLVEQRTLACGRCDFRPVCRFERAYNRPRVAEAVLPGPGAAGAGPAAHEEGGV
jgi:ATP-dependent helicase/nuclease subunit B